ncbi:MAG: rhodanese-like domain-containing protein [Myxococcales bacterium]|nr:rhodanese-like domain-containing protein [Myxococcales bacterium]
MAKAGGKGVPKLKPGAKILDVRTPAEYGMSHLEGAVNVPVGALKRRLAEVGPKDGQVLLYCNSGAKSAKAATILKDAGYKDVVDGGAMSNLHAPASDKGGQQTAAPVNRQQRRMQKRAQRRQRSR